MESADSASARTEHGATNHLVAASTAFGMICVSRAILISAMATSEVVEPLAVIEQREHVLLG
jgi:folate-dependent phosphoribosylglycinamide formyltransferase PurN